MPQDYFNQRKKTVLEKQDKSSIGSWDKKIKRLCDLINDLPQYYTTSSCSGRIVLMKDQKTKSKGLFIKQYHDKISFENLKKDLDKITKNKKFSDKLIKFKQEPMILHAACKTLEDANHLMKLAQKSGFKKIGIIALNKRVIIEINGSEKLEFPLIRNNKILVEDDFLEIVLEKANENLERNWDKIKEFEKEI